MTPKKLILWDIDGTLLSSGGVAGACMRAAMLKVYGQMSEQERYQYAGKTDRQIILETFVDRDPEVLMASLDRFAEAYMAELETQRPLLIERGVALPGAYATIEHLTGEPVIQSALTGNLAPVARLKLELIGLVGFLDLDVGAYGSDHHDRTRLPAIAAERAEQRYGRPFAGQDVVIIGDTPNDIACGKAFEARTIAVASGPYTADELRAHHPDAVLDSLVDLLATRRAIFG
jgi:phosphoglycolate phosphatase